MASLLINNSRKSIYIYFLFIITITLCLIYFYSFKQPGIKKHFQEQAFYLNYAAFKNSIYLSHLKFISRSNQVQKIDVWKQNRANIDANKSTVIHSSNEALDYNSIGFPIGTDILEKTREVPGSINNCVQVWRFLMGPLQAQIKHKKNTSNYWAILKNNGKCVFYAPDILKHKIIYDSANGSVKFFTIKDE